EMARTRELDPSWPMLPAREEGVLALRVGLHEQADQLLTRAVRDNPEVELARLAAQAVVENKAREGARSEPIKRLVEQFPRDGILSCYYAKSLRQDKKAADALRELSRARDLGADPARVLSPKEVGEIERLGSQDLPILLARPSKEVPATFPSAQQVVEML